MVMNAKEFKVICVGIGEMGKVGVKTLMDHKVEIVAAVDIDDGVIGWDLGEFVGYPACGVTIEKDFAAAVERTNPNIAFFASDPGWENLTRELLICAEKRINVVMTVMDTYYPMEHSRKEFAEIDEAFKKNGVSLFSSGINDIWWSGIGMDIFGSCKRVEAVDFTNRLPLNEMGRGVARDFFVNHDPKEYLRRMNSIDMATDESVSGPLMALYVNADILGLHIKNVKIEAVPCIAVKDIPMPQWDLVIEKGKMTGSGFDIEMTTEEGITLTTSMEVKVMDEGEKPGTTWTVKGEPNLHIDLGDICGEITTSSITVNRIPEVVAARPGIITLADLKTRPTFHAGEWTEV